jgi:cell filamentation protein
MGIDDANLLQEIEALLLQQAYQVFINELNETVRFDESYFKALHHRTFIGLYDWAGEYRSVDMRKGGSLFCLARNLYSSSRHIFQQIEQEHFLKNVSDWDREPFSQRLAFYQSELIALHPFYELNGRITRLFFDLIAIFNGYEPIDYRHALKNETSPVNDYILASVACVQNADESLLQKIIFTGLKKMEESA